MIMPYTISTHAGYEFFCPRDTTTPCKASIRECAPDEQADLHIQGKHTAGFAVPLAAVFAFVDHVRPPLLEGEERTRLLGMCATLREERDGSRRVERRQASRIQSLEAEIGRVRAQLPEDMKGCTLRFVECPVGHGRLTAANWDDTGCLVCDRDALRAELAAERTDRQALVAQAKAAQDALAAVRAKKVRYVVGSALPRLDAARSALVDIVAAAQQALRDSGRDTTDDPGAGRANDAPPSTRD